MRFQCRRITRADELVARLPSRGFTTGVVRLPIASGLPPHLSSVTPPTLTTTVVSKHTRRHTDAALGPFLSLKLLLLNFAGRVGAGVVPLDCCAHT